MLNINKDLIRQTLIVLAMAATLLVNGLASALPMDGVQTSELAARFPVAFMPASSAFRIWRLIYLGLVAYALYQALPAQRRNPRLRSIGVPFLAACLANMAWILLWRYQIIPLTLVAMLALLAALIVLYRRLRIGRSSPPMVERWAVNLPFSLTLGWITLLTIANVAVLLRFWGWNGFGVSDAAWLMAVLALTLVIATLAALTRGDVAFLLALAWGLVGVGRQQTAATPAATAAWVAVGYVLALVVVSLLRGWRRPAPARAV